VLSGFHLKNLSYGRINVGESREEYICNYPDGHVNGLFTGRFSIVWDGEGTITCKSSGYEAYIKFKEKVVYSTILNHQSLYLDLL
jgi:hypothetical protein